jgi:hypothetical protein
MLKYRDSAHRPLTSTSRQRDERVQLHKDARRFSNVCSRTEVVGEPTMCVVRCSRAKLVISHARAEPNWSAARKRPMWNHPRQSPTIHPSLSYFPVFSSPTATLEVVGNTGNMSSEKAGVGGSTLPGTTFHLMRAEFHVSRKPTHTMLSSLRTLVPVSSFGVRTFIFASRTFIICAHPQADSFRPPSPPSSPTHPSPRTPTASSDRG